MRLGRGGNIGVADLSGELLADRPGDRLEADHSGQRREGAEQRRVRHRPADMFEREFGRRHGDGMAGRQLGHHRLEVEVGKTPVGVDQEIAAVLEALQNVDRLEQRHVLDDQRVRHGDRLAQPDFLGVDAAKGNDGRAHTLGAKTGKGLRVLILEERRDGEHGRRCNDALAPASMDTNLKH